MTKLRVFGWMVVSLSLCVACKKTEETKDDKSEKSEKADKSSKKKSGDDEEEKGDKPEKSAKKKDAKACPDKYNAFKDHDSSEEQTCSCEADHAGGGLWGSGVYTEDSSPCAAAVHAGVIKGADGGTITMKHAKGCASYVGTTKNGVTSHGWGKYDGSFYFPEKGDGKCTKSTACPGTFSSVPNLDDETEITCDCSANPSGSVWGTHPYTQDSNICAAAVHAGVITKDEGGSVTAKASPGCSKYDGSKKNGVTSSGWGPYDSSFHFPSKGDGVCKDVKVVTDAKWKVGDAVDANWNGAWYQANVIALAPGKYRVHYVGYASSWDEWVPVSRLRARTSSSLKGSGK
ncbi:MAG: hypothetical protein HYV09_19405 [Deltaproteobacteria bacterium]|nr:hypothetical protein [Deltaproteobacteria bacterium]